MILWKDTKIQDEIVNKPKSHSLFKNCKKETKPMNYAEKYHEFVSMIENVNEHDVVKFLNKGTMNNGKNPNYYQEVALFSIIKTKPHYAYRYARDVIKGRWAEVEEVIKTNPEYAYYYAKDVIKGRWAEGESIIKTDPEYTYLYAIDVIKGRLPEELESVFQQTSCAT